MTVMGEDEFWAIVEQARADVDDTLTGDGAEEVAENIGGRLADLGPEAAVAFTLRYDRLSAQSYDWKLWGAASLMMGGCSDDAFDYFRGWLVAQGRRAWERALEDPDTLADLGVDPDDDDLECETMLSVGEAAFPDDEDFHAAVVAARDTAPPDTADRTPAGDDFDHEDEDEVRVRLPRLAAVYL